jgi:hypothetical protein
MKVYRRIIATVHVASVEAIGPVDKEGLRRLSVLIVLHV